MVAQAETSNSAIVERPRCSVGRFWPKVEDDMLQTIWSIFNHRDIIGLQTVQSYQIHHNSISV